MAQDNVIPTKRISHPFLIGLFVIAGTFATIAVILWLGASKFFEEYQIYSTYVDGSAEGLEVGKPVKYQGIPVGNIRGIRMAPDGKLVQIDMEIDKAMQINDRLRVRMELAGITGGKFLQLYYPEKPELALDHPKLSFEPRYPVIPSTPSGIEAIENAINDIVNNVRGVEATKISDEALRLLRSASRVAENPQIEASIANLNNSTAALARLFARLDSSHIIEQLAVTSKNFSDMSVQMRGTAAELSKQVSGLNLSGRADLALARYDSLMINANNSVSKVGSRAETAIFTLRETLEEIRNTNKQVSRSLREISDNPGKAFLSEPPPAD